MTNKTLNTALNVLLVILLSVIAVLSQCRRDVRIERQTKIVHDTIKYKPEAKTEKILKYYPVKGDLITETLFIGNDTIIEPKVPITQKEYEDSTYRAWVSGYKPNLDSIEIYRKTIYQTSVIDNTPKFYVNISAEVAPQLKESQVSASLDYNITPKFNMVIGYRFSEESTPFVKAGYKIKLK